MIKECHYATVRKLHANGLNDRQIGAEFGVGPCAIRRLRKRLGLPAIGVPRPNTEKKVSDDQLIQWTAEGLTTSEMAARGGVAYSTIHKRLLRMKTVCTGRVNANREASEPACEATDAFLAAFRPGSYLPPTHSRRAETSNRDGRIYGLPVAICTASSLYGA